MNRYLIVDDEHMAHQIIKGYCDLLSNMQLMAHCYDAFDALDYLRENTVDLIFLDLNMPKLKGFDFLRTLPNPPKVIVTTAYKEFALEGYELEITDYLLKPFSFERFLKAVNKAIQVKQSNPTTIPPLTSTKTGYVFLYSDKKHIQVKIDEILYVEAAGNYSKVITEKTSILVREKISEMVQLLSSEDFMRVHKSFIIAKEHIIAIEGNRIKLADRIIPIGSLYKINVLKLIKKG